MALCWEALRYAWFVVIKQVQVDMDGRTAILKGTVGSEADKKMMERLLGLEPGVSKIKNELTVTKK